MLNVELFENIENNSVLELLQCIGIKTKVYKKGAYIVKTGSKVDFLGIILEGNATISKTDSLLRTTIIETLKVNDIFAHNIVCLGIKKSPVDIIAQNKCEVLFLPFEKVIMPCNKVCNGHLQLIRNIMKMISKRNTLLNDKIDIIGQKTIRDKVLSMLQSYSSGEGSFLIPYTRQEMADFLCSDRCALSRELCKMRDEGIIKFNKNEFELLNRLPESKG